jgi:hypothetical protein
MKGRFSWLTPPSFREARTIAFMLTSMDDPLPAAREWATSAWHAWDIYHANVHEWYEAILKGPARSA